MKLINLKNTNPALLIVDVQKAFLDKDYPGLIRNNLDAEKTCGLILNKWRELKFPVIHVRHSSRPKPFNNFNQPNYWHGLGRF